DILSGRLKPGEQLPTHRDLADRLKVTVGTVSRGYSEARKAGWISGEIGRGTYVLDRNAGQFPATAEHRDNVIDLSLNVPVETSAPDLAAALRGLSSMEDTQSLLRYMPEDPYSARLAGQMVLERHGLSIDADKIVLCAGTQHGLGVALDVVARAGNCILAEELTYPAFKPLADARGLRTYPVALDEHGIVPSALQAACRKVRPKALYIVPTLHNPTTETLSTSRRKELVEIARRHNLIIIEDDLYRMLAIEAP